jgi:hypothetical protein
MMRIARVLAAITLLLGTAFVAGPAGAASRPAPPSATVTTTTRVVATCTVSPPFAPPRTQEYTVTVTVPRRVAPGSQAEIGVTVDYPVVVTATAGAISVRAQQTGDTGAQQFIVVPPGSPRLEGTATFPVTGSAGSDIVWTVEYWGQVVFFGGSSASETCRPTTPVSVPATRIESGTKLPPALRHLLEHVCAKPSVPRPLADWCRLLG